MRAKEFIVANEATLKYPAEIAASVHLQPRLRRREVPLMEIKRNR